MSVKQTAVSIILPFKDRFGFLREACHSVFQQDYQDYELILIDDGSNPAFADKDILENPHVRYFFQNNAGPAAARNKGILEAKGKFIAFLDSDDLFHPDKLSLQIQTMENHPEAVLSHTSFFQFKNSVHEGLVTVDTSEMSGHLFPRIVLSCPIATPTVMIRAETMKNYLFDEDMRIGEDTVLWTRLSIKFTFLHVAKPLSYIRIHGSNAAFDYKNYFQNSQNILLKLREHGVCVPFPQRYLKLIKSFLITFVAKTLKKKK